MFSTNFTVTPEMLEEEYQHLHHADIFKILEQGRLQFLDALGVPQESLLKEDCFLVLTKSTIQFLREIRDEELACTVKVRESLDESRFVLEQELFKKPRRIAVRATFELISMSGATRRRIPLPRNLKEKFAACLDSGCPSQ